MPMIGQKASASRHGGERPQSRPAGDQEHDQELILDGVDRFDACKDLTGHHPRQRDAAMLFMIGVKPLLNASRRTGSNA